MNKFWFVVWKDNSPKGWLITLVFLFILIKLIFFPLISVAAGTSLPLAIVESCSMYHDGNLFSDTDAWWERHENKYDNFDIEESDFENFHFEKGFNKGDILFIARPTNIEVGDVIVFLSGRSNPVIHRVIKIREDNGEKIYETIGDNNNVQLTPLNNGQGINEASIKEEQIIGKAKAKIGPYIGWIKLILFESQRPQNEREGSKERLK